MPDARARPFPLLAVLLALAATAAAARDANRATAPQEPAGAPADAPLAATGTLAVEGGTIRYFFDAEDYALPRAALLDWVRRSARAVASYYGRFPVREAHLAVVQVDGKGVRTGTSIGGASPTINVFLGRQSDADDLAADWILVHEMVHLAFPSVARRHHWIEEGLATYVESIARAGAGDLTPEFVWGGFVRGMPHGLPAPGDGGLDHTPTWGRTYWGGALFCLLADIEIRARSDGRLGLRDALRALVEAGATIERDMAIEAAFAVADAPLGAPVLGELYARWKATPVAVDLAALWVRLGVRTSAAGTVFEEAAPLAPVRRAITARLREHP